MHISELVKLQIGGILLFNKDSRLIIDSIIPAAENVCPKFPLFAVTLIKFICELFSKRKLAIQSIAWLSDISPAFVPVACAFIKKLFYLKFIKDSLLINNAYFIAKNAPYPFSSGFTKWFPSLLIP